MARRLIVSGISGFQLSGQGTRVPFLIQPSADWLTELYAKDLKRLPRLAHALEEVLKETGFSTLDRDEFAELVEFKRNSTPPKHLEVIVCLANPGHRAEGNKFLTLTREPSGFTQLQPLSLDQCPHTAYFAVRRSLVI